jgi:hypothetical protein
MEHYAEIGVIFRHMYIMVEQWKILVPIFITGL